MGTTLYGALLIPSSVNHVDFGSRVEFDSTFDGNGHGTRTAGSRTFGVTEGASVSAVKMMPEGGVLPARRGMYMIAGWRSAATGENARRVSAAS